MTFDLNIIRPICDADRDTLVAIWLEASKHAHAFLGKERLLQQAQQVRDIYLVEAENWVITQAGKPVGFIGLLGNFVGGLFIDPDMQGKGLGRQLLQHALHNKQMLELSLYALNQTAHQFYLGNGFVETARQPRDDEGLPFEVIFMRSSGTAL